MKIEQAQLFQPITITLDTAFEAETFISLILVAEKELTADLDMIQRKMLVEISNIFSDRINI